MNKNTKRLIVEAVVCATVGAVTYFASRPTKEEREVLDALNPKKPKEASKSKSPESKEEKAS